MLFLCYFLHFFFLVVTAKKCFERRKFIPVESGFRVQIDAKGDERGGVGFINTLYHSARRFKKSCDAADSF